ncbi:MAG: M20/M25/M40 family metallo-hydrolase [Chloroflexi bacterium]|nr:M20/M25/M40 family metallo-hydrolase [Chloroflexota bacterium]
MDERVLAHLRAHAGRHIEELQALVQIPSVVGQQEGVQACAAWLADALRAMGAAPVIVEEMEYPVVMGQVQGQSDRSLLVYCHYDVQPAGEPEWRFGPFSATIHDGRMYGRGTVDDKGALIATMQAARAYLECGLRPPVTVKFLFEGEEEMSSPSLRDVLVRRRAFLESDALGNFGDNVWEDGRPRVVCGLKGLCLLRLETHNRREFHARYSPLVEGAAWRLAWAINSLQGRDGRIRVRGFYDDVVPPQPADIQALVDLGWDPQQVLQQSGQSAFPGGKTDLEALVAYMLEPTVNLQGVSGGYLSPQPKGVVPASAAAELRFGLVPNQTPERVCQLVRAHLDAEGFDDVQVTLLGRNPWARTPLNSPFVQAMARSLRAAFGREVAFQPAYTGSGPEGLFQELFPTMEHAYTGFGPTEDNLHAPNEYIVLDDYLRGIEAVARLYSEHAAA